MMIIAFALEDSRRKAKKPEKKKEEKYPPLMDLGRQLEPLFFLVCIICFRRRMANSEAIYFILVSNI